MTSPSKRATISKLDHERLLSEVQVSKEDLNRLVMDYLVIEGYKSAAEHFSRESGLKPNVDLDSIENRRIIRNAIQGGRIEEAIERVNELNPEILDTNPSLFFHLQQQRLIEYIRQGQVLEALAFAQQELAPRGEENPEFLAELEKTMALLAFELPLDPSESNGKVATKAVDSAPSSIPSSISNLLHPSQRQYTAQEVNAAILTSQSHGREPKLPGLVRMLAWGENLLQEKADFPHYDWGELLDSRPKDAREEGPDAMLL